MKNIAKFLSIIAFVCVGSLTSCDTDAIGTLYDKKALAEGKPTDNTKVTFELPPEVKPYAE